VCLFSFGIPFLLAGGGQDTYSDILLQPRASSTPTPLDRALTQQAFASLFFTSTSFPVIQGDTEAPSPTLPAAGILVTGPTTTATISPTPTKTLFPIFVALTRISSGGGLFSNPTATLTSTPLPTHTAVPTATLSLTPLPTNTPAPTNTFTPEPTNTHQPTNTLEPTGTPVSPTDTPVPPTNTPVPPPTNTPEPPPTNTPNSGGNSTNGATTGFNLIFLLPFAILLPRLLFKL